jgi:hypothetical protein
VIDPEESRQQYQMGALRVISLLEETAADKPEPTRAALSRIARDLRTALGAANILVGDGPAEVIERKRLVAALEQIAQAPDGCGSIARRVLGKS